MSKKHRHKEIFQHIAIIDAGAKGSSIGKAPDGRIIVLPNAVPGDVADVQITKKRSAYMEGVAIAFHKYSEKRQTPLCSHFGVCGGCKWQYMSYEHQLFYKQKEVENNLRRIGKLELPEISPIVAAPKPYFYRNKMEFSFSDSRWLTSEELRSEKESGAKNALGFHIPGRWDKVLDIKHCYLQENPSNEIRLKTKDFAIKNGLSFFNPKTRSGLLRSMMIRITSIGEIMVVIQFFEDDFQKRETLLSYLMAEFPQLTSLQYTINPKANDSIYAQHLICFAGRNYIVEKMEGLTFKINAKSFYQTNSEQAYQLYKIIRRFAGLTGNELVYDLYTGAGTIALFMAKEAKKVIGIETIPEAVEDAKANAQTNGIANVDFFAGDIKHLFNGDFTAKNGAPDVVITDPPRDGMHKDVVQQLLNSAPRKIVYVSCNSATQARDIALMSDVYKVTKVQPVDMFPQTHHVENVVLLEKR